MKTVGNMFVLNFVMLTFRLIGMAPMTTSKSNPNDWYGKTKESRIKFSWSWTGVVHNLGLIFGVFLGCYIYMPLIIKRGAMDHSKLSSVYRNTLMVTANAVLVILYLAFCIGQSKAISLGNKLMDIDSSLEQLRRIYKLKTRKNYVLGVILSNIIFTMVFVGIYSAVTQHVMGFMITIVFNCAMFSFYILQYGLVIFSIERRFSCLNQALLSFETRNSGVPESVVVDSVIIIRRAYCTLYELCPEIANVYAPLTIYISLYFSTTSLYTLYTSFISITEGHLEDSTIAVGLLANFIWMSIRTYPFILLTSSARKTLIEMRMTSDITHKLLAKFTTHREIKIELKNFTMDLMHMNFQFTACGVLLIDCSLLKSMVSTITTYLVIFIQFQLAGNNYTEVKE